MTADSPSSRAGEYILGTLSQPERDAFEAELAGNVELQAEVQEWRRRLAPLNDMVAQEQPPETVWHAIERRLDGETDGSAQTIIVLKRSLRRWQGLAFAASALAAALVVLMGAGGHFPSSGGQQSYLAVVNRGGDLPALIVRVDETLGIVQVRSLGVETPPDRSLELWYVGEGQNPKSLGVLENAAQPVVLPSSIKRSVAEGGLIAVTVEPKGGSPTGAATGPIVYSGKLIKDQP